MRNAWHIAAREFRATVSSPMGWGILAAFLVVTGFFFAAMVGFYVEETASMGMNPYVDQPFDLNVYLVGPFFSNTALILLFLCPALSMRLFAEDRKTQSLELLLTAPVSTFEIVFGKSLGGMAFVGLILLCTLHYPLVLFVYGSPDLAVVAAGYLATLLLTGSFMALGTLASACTESQVLAMIASFAALLVIWVASWAEPSAGGAWWASALAQLSLLNHFEQMSKGIIRLEDLTYYVSFIGFFLFATWQRVEAFRWR